VGQLLVRAAAPAGGGFSPGTPLFFDDFDYTVTNSTAQAAANKAAFLGAGWVAVRTDNLGFGVMDGSQAELPHGEIYSVVPADIPGHSGAFPGSVQKAMLFHSKALADSAQTDFFLQYGGSLGTIPANVYFQFWIYVVRSGAWQTDFHGREKFIYPTRNTYPATIGNNGGHWLFELAKNSFNPNNVEAAGAGECYLLSYDSTIVSSTPVFDDATAIANGTQSYLGQTASASRFLVPNEWIEVRIHYDTSGANGVFEVWTRRVGQAWSKITEWIGGVTPNFTWAIDAAFRDGHAAFQMPSTMPGPGSTTPAYNAWWAMQDFAIATSEANLPKYEGY